MPGILATVMAMRPRKEKKAMRSSLIMMAMWSMKAMRQFHLESRAAPDMVATLVDSAYTTGEPQQRYEVLAIMAMSAHYLVFEWIDEFDGFRRLVDDAVRPLANNPKNLPDELRPLLAIVGQLLGEDWTDASGDEVEDDERDQLGFDFT